MTNAKTEAIKSYSRQRNSLYMSKRRLEILKDLNLEEDELHFFENSINRHTIPITQSEVDNFELNNPSQQQQQSDNIENQYVKLEGNIETSWLISRTQALNKCFEEENFIGAAFQIEKFFIYIGSQDSKNNGRIEKFVRCGLVPKLINTVRNYFFDEWLNSKYNFNLKFLPPKIFKNLIFLVKEGYKCEADFQQYQHNDLKKKEIKVIKDIISILCIVSSGNDNQIMELYQCKYFEILPKMIHLKQSKIMLDSVLTLANILGCNPAKFKPLLDRENLLDQIVDFLQENSTIFVHKEASKNITFLLSNYCLRGGSTTGNVNFFLLGLIQY